MKILIAGAGTLGRLLAERLCEEKHDVTIIDESRDGFDRLKEKVDLMTVEGAYTDISVLKRADIAGTDLLLAVSGDESSNLVLCRLAEHFGVKKTICRMNHYDVQKNVFPTELFNVWRAFSSSNECVHKITDVLDNQISLEKIQFSNPLALLELFNVSRSSPLAGTRLSDIPAIHSIRFAAIIRDSQFIIPHGDTIVVPDDKIYVAGHRDNVKAFLTWAQGAEQKNVRKIVISGAGTLGGLLAKEMIRNGYDVRIIESDRTNGEKLLDSLPPGSMVINGDATDEEILEEAGVSSCDAFIGTAEDDENNILSCIIAKRMGAGKVITVTHKPEYIRLVPGIEKIDCAFSSSLVSVNTILRLMESGTVRVDAQLQQFRAHLTEFKITEASPLYEKTLSECHLPSSIIFAMLFRFSDVISPSGTTVFQKDDTVVAIVTPESSQALKPFFPR